jgi:hypothetical protein
MNGAHLHLLLNHIPVTGSLFAFVLLLAGIIKKNHTLITAGLISVIIFSVFIIVAYLTGQEASNVVEQMSSINRNFLEEHSKLSEIVLWLYLLNGILALATVVTLIQTGKVSRILLYINLGVLLFMCILVAKTAYIGGHIRHSEINL